MFWNFNERKTGPWLNIEIETKKWPFYEIILDDVMEASTYSLQFNKLTSVSKVEHFQKHVPTQKDEKFELLHFKMLADLSAKEAINYSKFCNFNRDEGSYPNFLASFIAD